jgi:flagellar biosynthetic protein FlhB
MLMTQALTASTGLLFSVWLSALLVGVLQAGGVFSAEPLLPDFTRLNPANGLKRLFSLKSLHDLWRNAAKLVVIIVAMSIWGNHQLGDLMRLVGLPPRSLMLATLSLFGSALTVLAGLMLVFALLDWSFNRWEYLRQMRMSKREIKDEHKDREGDPRIKSRLRELRNEWLKRARQVSKVRNADVLLTNPTHYAVALEYRHGEMPAPMITARGAGDMAQRLRNEARRRGVPIVENAPLTRALFALKKSQTFVPEEHFSKVARILRWVYAARGSRRSGSAT